MKLVTLFFVGFLLLAACGDVDSSDNHTNLDAQGNRDFYELLPDRQLTDYEEEGVRRFDRWAFTDTQRYYYAPAADMNYVAKTGMLTELSRYWQINSDMVEATLFFRALASTRDVAKANLVFVGLDGAEGSLESDTAEKFGLGASVSFDTAGGFTPLSPSGCHARRIMDGFDILRTLIVITDLSEELSKERVRGLTACMNKGYYYHFGFNNVSAMPDEDFATHYREERGAYEFDVINAAAYAPISFLRGKMNGKNRKQVLRNYINGRRN